MAAKPRLPLNIPSSDVTVKVSAVDTTLRLTGIGSDQIWNPPIPGFGRFKAGTWAFLIEHPSGRKLLYDLGLRKDWKNLSPNVGLVKSFDAGIIAKIEVEKNISQILEERSVDLASIEGLIWSHFHWDHTGDPSTFPSSTALIVGPGTKANLLPGYPADPDGHVLETDFSGRELHEVDFSMSELQIGRFRAVDYFGDGSFYLLDSPGHAIGHINALSRTGPSPSPNFIHLGGDSAHHVAEIRPSMYMPLPETISSSPLPQLHPSACPGHIFAPVLRNGSASEHILEFQEPPGYHKGDPKYAIVYDEPALRDTIRKIEEVDAYEDVFTVLAHDWTLYGVIEEFPESLNQWKEKGWKQETTWKFLKDFEGGTLS